MIDLMGFERGVLKKGRYRRWGVGFTTDCCNLNVSFLLNESRVVLTRSRKKGEAWYLHVFFFDNKGT